MYISPQRNLLGSVWNPLSRPSGNLCVLYVLSWSTCVVLMPLANLWLCSFNCFGCDNLGFLMTWFFPPCSFKRVSAWVEFFGLVSPTMESPSTNRQKQAETQTPHTSTFLSQMHRFQIRETFGCAAVSVWSLSFIPFSNAGHATFNLSSCGCEMPGRVPNWRNQFAELLGILNLAKTFFEPCTLNNYLVLRSPWLTLWHQLFQKSFLTFQQYHLWKTIWQDVSMRQTWMVSKLFCEDINHLYVYSTGVAPSSWFFLLDFRRLKSQLDLTWQKQHRALCQGLNHHSSRGRHRGGRGSHHGTNSGNTVEDFLGTGDSSGWLAWQQLSWCSLYLYNALF